MFDINSIAVQVKSNCNISDAKYWGLYSPCGLLLRLRDLFKIENRLKPWDKIEPDKIGIWIEDREKLWHDLEPLDFHKIEINGKKYNPFDVKGINSVLPREGFFYGFGFGNLSKPTFFLAELLRKRRTGRYNVYMSGREIARDLSTAPAMLQGNNIIAKHETTTFYLWGKLEEMRLRKQESALSRAFSEYGIFKDDILTSERLAGYLNKVVHAELKTYIYHEFGEASQRNVLGKWWKNLVLNLSYSRAELFIRGLKDILSDTCTGGMLFHIIKNRKTGSLYFYVAIHGGLRKIIFPDIITAYDEFIATHNWALIEKARLAGYRKTREYIKILKKIVDEDKTSPENIEKELISKII